jgi:acyl-coenzyme A thioesterase 9
MRLVGSEATWGNGESIDKALLSSYLKKNQQDLIKQTMKESYAEAIIPLGDMPELRNKYANFQQAVRFGRLLEDLDTMAVHISYLHNKSQRVTLNGFSLSPIVIVTALVDRIEVNSDIKIDSNRNIKLSGFTSWVGRTSSEATMKVEQEISENEWQPVLEAKFLMAARDTNNKGSANMNPLDISNEGDRLIFELGEKNKLHRQNELKSSLFNVPPNEAESLHIHETFKSTIDLKTGTFKIRIKPENTVWMEDAMLKNVVVCFPEQRNLYNKIFGGFLMRQAYEIAWINASMFSKTVPKIETVDDITFKKPVLIGQLLFLSSQVVYTNEKFVQVKVHAQSVDIATNVKETTNDFFFKFSVDNGVKLPQIIPKSYAESMMYIDGKRHM